VQSAALTWLAWELTHQNSWPAFIQAAQTLPIFVLGLWGGSLADRWPRRPLIFLTQTIFLVLAILLGVLVGTGIITRGSLLLLALLIGLVNAVDTPARLAFVVDMVGRDDLANAVALNSLLFNLARAVGPALAGWLMRWLGAAGCFLFNGLTFVAILLALSAMRLPRRSPAPTPAGSPGNLMDAFRYLGQHPPLVLVLILGGAIALFGWPLLSLLPAIAVQHLHLPEGADNSGYSWMLSAIGAGALVGALVVASFKRRQLLMSLGVVLGASSLVCVALLPSLPLAVLGCAVAGGGLILFFATGLAALQLGSAEHNRGRIMGIWLMVLSGANPLGHVLSGQMADHYGVVFVLLVQAGGIAAAGAIVGVLALLLKDQPAQLEEKLHH
jgi:MFS family permease